MLFRIAFVLLFCHLHSPRCQTESNSDKVDLSIAVQFEPSPNLGLLQSILTEIANKLTASSDSRIALVEFSGNHPDGTVVVPLSEGIKPKSLEKKIKEKFGTPTDKSPSDWKKVGQLSRSLALSHKNPESMGHPNVVMVIAKFDRENEEEIKKLVDNALENDGGDIIVVLNRYEESTQSSKARIHSKSIDGSTIEDQIEGDASQIGQKVVDAIRKLLASCPPFTKSQSDCYYAKMIATGERQCSTEIFYVFQDDRSIPDYCMKNGSITACAKGNEMCERTCDKLAEWTKCETSKGCRSKETKTRIPDPGNKHTKHCPEKTKKCVECAKITRETIGHMTGGVVALAMLFVIAVGIAIAGVLYVVSLRKKPAKLVEYGDKDIEAKLDALNRSHGSTFVAPSLVKPPSLTMTPAEEFFKTYGTKGAEPKTTDQKSAEPKTGESAAKTSTEPAPTPTTKTSAGESAPKTATTAPKTVTTPAKTAVEAAKTAPSTAISETTAAKICDDGLHCEVRVRVFYSRREKDFGHRDRGDKLQALFDRIDAEKFQKSRFKIDWVPIECNMEPTKLLFRFDNSPDVNVVVDMEDKQNIGSIFSNDIVFVMENIGREMELLEKNPCDRHKK